MASQRKSLLSGLSTGDLKRMLAVRERIDVLEGEKKRLEKDLTKIERELTRLWAEGTGTPGRKSRTKKVGRKKAVRKKAAPKKAGARKKAPGKKKAPTRKTKASGSGKRVKLEDVVLGVLKKHGGPMSFKDLFSTIVKGKLVKTKSKNFDNVLRRTLSTSKLVKRVSRGVYGIA